MSRVVAGGGGPAGVVGAEDRAEVAESGRRQQRIAQRMGGHISVRMPGAAVVVREQQPGEPAGAGRSRSDGRRSRCPPGQRRPIRSVGCHQSLRFRQVGGSGDLESRPVTRNGADRNAERIDQSGIIGGRRLFGGGPGVRLPQHVRRRSPAGSAPRAAGPGRRRRPASRRRGPRAWCRPPAAPGSPRRLPARTASTTERIRRFRRERPRGVVDQHDVGVRTDSSQRGGDRRRPIRTADDDRQPIDSQLIVQQLTGTAQLISWRPRRPPDRHRPRAADQRRAATTPGRRPTRTPWAPQHPGVRRSRQREQEQRRSRREAIRDQRARPQPSPQTIRKPGPRRGCPRP